MVKVAINGLGRIGRQVLKIALENGVNVAAANDITDPRTLAHLFKYDSVYGVFKGKIGYTEDSLVINGKKIIILKEREPANLPWKKLGVDIVVESTGLFTDRENAVKHLQAGAKRVLISAPAKNPDFTLLIGVNEKELKKEHKIISVSSCTTNCLAPITKVLHDNFKIKEGFMTTVHAYTPDQRLHDAPHRDLRRARAACISLVPTTTGASRSVAEVISELRGKLEGIAIRAPVPCGSIVDFVALVEKKVSVKEVNHAVKRAAQKMPEIIEYTEEPLVSVDVIGNTHSSIFDASSTMVLGGNFVKVLAWYDNEYGYSCRMVDAIKLASKK